MRGSYCHFLSVFLLKTWCLVKCTYQSGHKLDLLWTIKKEESKKNETRFLNCKTIFIFRPKLNCLFQFEVTEKGWGYKNLLDNQIVRCLCGRNCIRGCCTTRPSQKLIRQKVWKYFNNEPGNNLNFNQQPQHVYDMTSLQ